MSQQKLETLLDPAGPLTGLKWESPSPQVRSGWGKKLFFLGMEVC